ncbi:MAG: Gfo/Idh/MocA family oxidoreductase [Phycisphaerae bacterium]|nr:Gfo/Idh/MocA family oxidoreductase [Phycisphaerae bacterium]
MTKRTITRRGFLRDTGKAAGAAGAALAAPYFVPGSALGKDGRAAPSNRITVGMIGLGRIVVYSNLKSFLTAPDCQIVALCDVDRWRLALSEDRTSIWGGKIKPDDVKGIARTTDFREVLGRKDIDAVMISTPDHWHVPMAVAAVKAGKDVCLEKPITRSIAEGRLLSDLVTEHKRVFRTDSEFRSKANFHRACELVRNGRIGKLHTIRTGVPIDKFDQPAIKEEPVPEELIYDMWLGPAAKAAYQQDRVHAQRQYTRSGWMRNLDYCDGMVTNWGTHLNDIAQWGNNTDRTGPVEVEGTGKYPPKGSLWNVLTEFEITYRYASGVTLVYKTEKPYVKFEGTEGWIYTEFGGPVTAEPKSILDEKIGPDEVHLLLKGEKRDFIDCVKSRGRTLEDAEVGHRTTSLCHLGQIAVRVGGKLKWDPEKERFTNSDEGNKLLSLPPGRRPWAL